MYRRRRRKVRRKKQLGQEAIPTTSLADMMFLLLIFFIMTSTLSRITGFMTDMPSGAAGQQQQQEKTPTIGLNEDRILFNDKEMSIDGLRSSLGELRLDQKTGEGKVVIVSASGPVRFQRYYEVLAAVQSSSGVVAIVTQEGDKQE